MDNYFTSLYEVDVHEKIKSKSGRNYLPWAVAWAEVKKRYPDSTYHIYENQDGRPWFDDGRSGWVKVDVTVNGITHRETLAIMDLKNLAVPSEKIMSTDAVKSIQRALTKACGRHGLGLYIYEGEEIPESVRKRKTAEEKEKQEQLKKIRTEIVEMAKKKISQGFSKDLVYNIIAQHNGGKKNPNSITDIDTCIEVKRLIQNLEGEDE